MEEKVATSGSKQWRSGVTTRKSRDKEKIIIIIVRERQKN